MRLHDCVGCFRRNAVTTVNGEKLCRSCAVGARARALAPRALPQAKCPMCGSVVDHMPVMDLAKFLSPRQLAAVQRIEQEERERDPDWSEM